MTPKYVDAHCHPNLGALKPDQEDVVKKMEDDGVLGIVVGVDKKTSKESVELAEKHEHLYATVGLHPNDTPEESFDKDFFTELIKSPKVVGIGECGLDFFRIKGDLEKEKERQWREFKFQVDFAIENDLPLMIHCRPSNGTVDSYEAALEYLEPKVKEVGSKLRGNMHFFVGNLAVAKRFWNIGFTTSFTGVLTFTKDYDEVVIEAPKHMYLTETDAPYAAPMPHRGKINNPSYVAFVVSAIARIRGEDEEEVRVQSIENAKRMFGLQG